MDFSVQVSNFILQSTAIIFFRSRGLSVLVLYAIASFLFIVITLLIIGGKNKKTACSIISSIVTLLITIMIAFYAIKSNVNSIKFETMPFMISLKDYQHVFYSGILISGLGAIMEIAITISSAIDELISNNPSITPKELYKSSSIIASDISGALMNVLLFTFIVGTFPTIILAIANNIGVFQAFSYFSYLEMVRFLVSSIGIVLSIPITRYFAILIIKGDRCR